MNFFRPLQMSTDQSAIYESVGGVKRKNDLHLGRDVVRRDLHNRSTGMGSEVVARSP
jgi:hypothetical protein